MRRPPVTLTVADDDSAATTVTLSVDTSQVDEDDGATVITVTGTLTGNTPSAATTVTLSVDSGAGGSGALAGTDFVPVEDFVLTIGAGATSSMATFTLTPTDDTIDEPDETLTLSGSPGSSNVGMAGTVAITIGDNDAAPALVLSVEPESIAEDGGTSTVTVSTGTGSTFATDQTIVLTLTGTATQGGDYTIEATSLVLPAGAGSAALSVSTTITGVDDTGADPGETVIVTGSVGGVDFDTARTITIADNEGSPTVTLVLTPEAVFEGRFQHGQRAGLAGIGRGIRRDGERGGRGSGRRRRLHPQRHDAELRRRSRAEHGRGDHRCDRRQRGQRRQDRHGVGHGFGGGGDGAGGRGADDPRRRGRGDAVAGGKRGQHQRGRRRGRRHGHGDGLDSHGLDLRHRPDHHAGDWRHRDAGARARTTPSTPPP